MRNSFCVPLILPCLPGEKEAAAEFSLEGDKLMEEKSFAAARKAYSEAIKLDPTNGVYYGKRYVRRNLIGLSAAPTAPS